MKTSAPWFTVLLPCLLALGPACAGDGMGPADASGPQRSGLPFVPGFAGDAPDGGERPRSARPGVAIGLGPQASAAGRGAPDPESSQAIPGLDDPSAGEVDPNISGLPPNLPLGELGGAEAAQLCEALSHAASAALANADARLLACVLLAFSSAAPDASGQVTLDPASCQGIVDLCMASTASVPPSLFPCDSGAFPANTLECDVTVGELELCLSETARALSVLATQLSCQALVDPDSAAAKVSSTVAEMAPQCARISVRCPTLLSGTTDAVFTVPGCSNTCLFAGDGVCDDGGAGSFDSGGGARCEIGTDCIDCGRR